jgi:histidine triad (HIT) family protein
MENCLFCKIVSGEIPSQKVYEDSETLAFLDINPVNPGHTLIIPKRHFDNIEEIPETVLCNVIMTVKKVGNALKKGLGVKGYNLQVNNDPIAGRIIPHIHVHVIPRLEDDGLKLWPQGEYREGEMSDVAGKIRSATD